VRLGEVIADALPGFACGERDAEGTVQLRMNNVDTRGNMVWDEFIRVPATDEQIAKYRLEPGDVLFNNTNSVELVGKTAMFRGYPEPVVFSNHFTRLRLKSEICDPSFLAHWLVCQWQSRVFANLCNRWVGQSAVKNDRLLALDMPLPPLTEQKRIVAMLHGYFLDLYLSTKEVARTLKPGGRCGIVLDEGVLFRTNETAFVQTKRKLLDDCDLWCIVSLPAGTFINAGAGVKANLLFLTRGGPTKQIWYYDLSDIKVGKKTPLTLTHFEEFFKLLPTRADSERSWTVSREAIEAKGFDLKAVNPNAKNEEDTRTPEELLDLIEAKGREIAEALAVLRSKPTQRDRE